MAPLEISPNTAKGRVTLAGAGPGDPELLTVKLLRRLAQADAIVHDALISDEIKALFPPTADIYDVGKRAGAADSTPQQVTNDLLVSLARRGLDVLRLKGGDPLIFGRGGEEAQVLADAGVPYEFIPGVSAFNGAAASAGIPLTHRKVSRSCMLLNGHGAHLDSIDWAALVALGGTWVFYMGTQTVAEIAQRLLDHGAPAHLPLALVEGATLDAQRTIIRPLDWVAREGLPLRKPYPGLVLVGPSVDVLHDTAAELTQTPLDGSFDASALSDQSQAAR